MGFVKSMLGFIAKLAVEVLSDESSGKTGPLADDEYADQDFYDPARDSLTHGVDAHGVTMDQDWYEGTRN